MGQKNSPDTQMTILSFIHFFKLKSHSLPSSVINLFIPKCFRNIKPFTKYPPPPLHSPLFHLLVFPIPHFTLLQFLTILLFLSFPAFPSFPPFTAFYGPLEANEGRWKISQILFCAAFPFGPSFFPALAQQIGHSFVEIQKNYWRGGLLDFHQWMATWPPSHRMDGTKKDVPKFTAASGWICDKSGQNLRPSFGALFLVNIFCLMKM